ncbi:uncharacterized protein LOC112213185 [Bombus impatiens]|uniref:Uncharacterized protein LOC112213185 n=1 Tax=Bombus impatiens TaxID=132113 RepID=A0A6P6FDB3_BOMIM|nr:uncharacterized protein LOC112213185 [Bombus impatiens]
MRLYGVYGDFIRLRNRLKNLDWIARSSSETSQMIHRSCLEKINEESNWCSEPGESIIAKIEDRNTIVDTLQYCKVRSSIISKPSYYDVIKSDDISLLPLFCKPGSEGDLNIHPRNSTIVLYQRRGHNTFFWECVGTIKNQFLSSMKSVIWNTRITSCMK